MTLLDEPHHDGSLRFVPDQAPSLGSRVTVFVSVPACAAVTEVHVRSTPDGEPRYAEAVVDRVVGTQRWWRAEVDVRNPVTRYRFLLHGPGGSRWLNAGGVFRYDVSDAADFRLLSYAPPPDWAADAVVYEIFPDRFARCAAAADRTPPPWALPCDWDTPVIGTGPETPYQFYGGDLDGIAEHLDHIVGLGANTIYLTPIFAAQSNHRYDAAAFDRVDPLLGGEDALLRLRDGARRRGLRLLGDLTTNHCGQTHDWFTAARSGSAAERSMFYPDGDDFETWLGFATLRKLNWGSAELRRRFAPIAQRWLRPPYSLDGWRVDVANMTGRRGADCYTHEVAALLREAVISAQPEALVVAEHTHDSTGDLDRNGWHGTMNHAGFLRPVWSFLRADTLDLPHFLGVPGPVPRRTGQQTVATMRSLLSQTSWRSLTHSWTLLGSHDTARIRTVVGAQAMQAALGLLMTYPGTPMVFAGDEFGLEGVNGEDARRPMPWGAATLGIYPELIGLRRSHPALVQGGLRWAYVDDDTLAFFRESPQERLLVCVRRGTSTEVTLPLAGAELVYGTASVTPDGVRLAPGPSFAVLALS